MSLLRCRLVAKSARFIPARSQVRVLPPLKNNRGCPWWDIEEEEANEKMD